MRPPKKPSFHVKPQLLLKISGSTNASKTKTEAAPIMNMLTITPAKDPRSPNHRTSQKENNLLSIKEKKVASAPRIPQDFP